VNQEERKSECYIYEASYKHKGSLGINGFMENL